MSAKYDRIGIGYNETRKADPYLTQRLIHHLQPQPGGTYLDVGCGSGNYTIQLQTHVGNWIGIDPSEHMLDLARQRNQQVEWRQGRAEETGLEDESVDGIIGTLTIHHWTNLRNSFAELHRVLRPGGRLVIFAATPEQTAGYWLNHYFPKMLADSVAQLPPTNAVTAAMSQAGFTLNKTEPYSVKPNLQDCFLYCGKHDPERYFDPNIRRGISSFSDLSNTDEVESGLAQLRKDIDSGKVRELIKTHENDLGDYLYLVSHKS